MKYFVVLALFLIFNPGAFAQARPIPPGIRQADQASEQAERNLPPPLYRRSPTDLAKIRHNADELASLAQGIPSSIDQTTKGMLDKDLPEKLKRIEKLAKELRSQISR